MEVHPSGYHRLEAVAASSDRARKRGVALYLPLALAIVASVALHSATLLAPRASAEGQAPTRSSPGAPDVDVDVFESSDIDVRPNGVEGAPDSLAAASPDVPPAEPSPADPAEPAETDVSVDEPDAQEPVPTVKPSSAPTSVPSAPTPPRPPPIVPPPPPPTSTSSAVAPPRSAASSPAPPTSATGTGGGSSMAPPNQPPPGFSANTPPAAARLVFHVVRENAEGKDWGTLAAGSQAELRAVLAIDAAGKTTCTPDEGSPAHLVRALTNACFRLRAEKVSLDVNRYGPGRVRVRIVASISDVPVPADRPDGIFGLAQRFAEGKGHGEFTQTNGRRVEILLEVERIDATP